MQQLPDTIRQEHADRVNRLARLSEKYQTPPPEVVNDLQVAAGTLPGVDYPVPVTRLRYKEQTFFDFNSVVVKEEALPIIDTLATAMSRDLPDTSLVILGHTDAAGTDDYNEKLSLRRAAAVMELLAQRGVPTPQMTTVGIGKSQPVATNSSEAGRAQNRRVEFLISRYEDANLKLVSETPRNAAFLIDYPGKAVKPASIQQPRLRVMTGSSTIAQPVAGKPNTVTPIISKKADLIPLQDTVKYITLVQPYDKDTVDELPP